MPTKDYINKVTCGDCLELMKNLDDNSVDLVVTSPPYNIDKPYIEVSDNIPPEEYIEFLRLSCKEMFRLIKPNSSIFINIADIGISNKDANGEHRIGPRGNFYVIPHHIRVIESMLEYGAQYLNPIIWRKISNCSSQFGANPRFCGTYPYPKNCHVPSEIEFILHFRKNGLPQKPSKKIKELSRVSKERWMELSSQIWDFGGVTNQKEHPAQFPRELPLRCIEGWSFVNEVVLDPFLGIGNTIIVAKQLNRNFIGFEISEEYCKIARKRLEQSVMGDFTKIKEVKSGDSLP